MTRQRQFSQREIYEIGLALEAKQLRAQAELLPHGPLRTEVERQARLAETASHANDWVRSSGLQAPN